MAQIRASIAQHRGEEVYAALQHSDSFHCLVEEWRDCEELEPQPTEKLFLSTKSRCKETLHGVVCDHKQVPFHEMRKGTKMKMPGKCRAC